MTSAEDIRDAQRATWARLSASWQKRDSVIMDQLRPVSTTIMERLDIAGDTGEPGLSIAKLSQTQA